MYDLESTDYYTDPKLVDEPHPFFEQLRGQGPVFKLPNRNVVAVTGYDEAIAIYNDTEHFVSTNAVTGPIPDLPFMPEGDDISDQIEAHRDQIPFAQEVVGLHPPRHTQMRSLLNPLFVPSRLRELDPGFRRTASQLIDEFSPDGHVEFIGCYANPLATLIITELLGIPDEDRRTFRKYFEGNPAGAVGASAEEIAYNPLIEMGMRIAGYIAERRQSPRGDILSQFALATFPDGTTPSLEQAARAASFLFGAGQDTTQKLLGTSLRVIAERQDLQDMLRANPDQIPNFIEEALRFDGSIKASHRLCRKTVTVGGVEIKAGTTVLLANLGANRDPRRFADPDVFLVDRPKRREHLAFGRGIHTCAGAPLARTEARISLELILRRFGRIEIDADLHGPPDERTFHYEPSYVLRGLEELNLVFLTS